MSAILNFEIILYVEDQQRARDFYTATLAIEPSLDVPGMTEFKIGGATLGLMPALGIRKLLGDAVPEHSRDARCELYIGVDDPAEVASRAIQHGAKELSPLQVRDWGDDVIYLADLDNHIIAFARKSV
jgi:uncharacterized glyoxalase superfamily protein PhnB